MRESQTARLSFAFLVLLNQIAAVYKTVTKFCAGMILKRDQQSKSETSIRKTVLLASLGVDHSDLISSHLQHFRVNRAPEGLVFLKGVVETMAPDLVILDCHELNEIVLATLGEIRSVLAAPILVLSEIGTAESGQKALRAGADSCVIDGLIGHRLTYLVAIAAEHYKINSEIRGELDKAKSTLETRKLIDRAKGVLMDQRGLKEAEAYELMRQNAMSKNLTMRQVAENILSVSGLFG